MSAGASIVSFELLAVDLPLRRPFKHAAADRSVSQSVFLKCVTDSGAVGFGESLPRRYVTGETCDSVYALLADAILPRLVATRFSSLADVESFLTACDGRAPRDWVDPATPQGAAWCAVDLALLDAFGRAFKTRPLAAHAASTSPHFRYSGVLSDNGGLARTVSALRQRLYGFRHIKVKVSPGTRDAALRWVHRLCGRGIEVRIDANMSWAREQALAHMQALARHGICMFEQPLAANDLSGLAWLTAQSGLGVMADESFTTRESLAELISRRACTAVNARISKCGGLLATFARCREAMAAGLDVQIGCQVGESSLLSAAQLVLLSTVAPVRYAEGCFGLHLLREDPASPLLQFGFGGRPPARPSGPGFGVTMDERVLARFATRRDYVPASARSANRSVGAEYAARTQSHSEQRAATQEG